MLERLAIRVDGNAWIGAGHVMRCCAIAGAALEAGAAVDFLVSDEESAQMLREQGFKSAVLGGSYDGLSRSDAEVLCDALACVDASSVLVDTYAASDEFFEQLRYRSRDLGVRVGYIDDEFRFCSGFTSDPVRYPVDVIVNYGFNADDRRYSEVYGGAVDTALLVGLEYAPLRQGFRGAGYEVGDLVRNVLVTSGSTNPCHVLERMALCCLDALPQVEVHVIVGPNAKFDDDWLRGRVILHHSPNDLRCLMMRADLVVSAAGTTLYELASLGVPTIAVPITENQMANIKGWSKREMGPFLGEVGWGDSQLIDAVADFAGDSHRRSVSSRRLTAACDGRGASRIVATMLR